jgi:ABC-type branched-subunit amino acid transport system substrate-binding protein
MKKFLLIPLVVILISGLILVGCAKPAPEEPVPEEPVPEEPAPEEPEPVKTLRIGLINDLSGFLSAYMILERDYTEIMAQMINDGGGITIQGEKYNIELIVEDSQTSVDGAMAATNKLVYDHQVKYIIGGIAFENKAITPICEQNKVFRIIFYATTDPTEVSSDTPYTFVGVCSAVEQDIAVATAARKEFPDVKNIVLTTADDGTQYYSVPVLLPTLDRLGFTVLNDGEPVLFPNEMQDFTPIADKINLLKPDGVIIINAHPAAVTGITKGLRALGNMAPVCCHAFPGDISTFIDIIGPAGSTNFLTLNWTRDDPDSPPLFKELESKCPPDKPIDFTQPADLHVLAQVIQKADSLDVDVVKATWESMESIEGLFGHTVFCGDQTFGLKHHTLAASVQYQKLMDGQVQVLPYSDWISYDPIP